MSPCFITGTVCEQVERPRRDIHTMTCFRVNQLGIVSLPSKTSCLLAGVLKMKGLVISWGRFCMASLIYDTANLGV